MKTFHFIIWIIPFLILIAGFFTSRLQQFRLERYGVYTGVLFVAFLFNLQSKSFIFDPIDIVFSQIVLLVFSDFFWRVIRRKNKIIRFGAGITGLALFLITYQDWILLGPASIDRFTQTKRITEKKAGRGVFFIKEHWSYTKKEGRSRDLVLFRKSTPPFIEQRIDSYKIPDGYANSTFSFAWEAVPHSVSVQVIGDNDTLWTLGEPIIEE